MFRPIFMHPALQLCSSCALTLLQRSTDGCERFKQSPMNENQDPLSEANRQDFFIRRFFKVMKEMGQNTQNDPEGVWMIGSLAASLLDQSQSRSWAHFKKALTPEVYNGLVESLRKQGNKLAGEGKEKAAFAVEVIALSIIAPTQSGNNEHLSSGDKLLNKRVQDSVDFFRRNEAARGRPN